MKVLALGTVLACAALTANAEQQAPAPRAVECVSVFEIMQRAAPNWMNQPQVNQARLSWRREAGTLAQRTGVDYGTQINREMTRLADKSTTNPNALTTLALNCVAEAKS